MKHLKINFILCMALVILLTGLYGCTETPPGPENTDSNATDKPKITIIVTPEPDFKAVDFTGEWHRTNVPESDKAIIKLSEQKDEGKDNKRITYQLTIYSADLIDPNMPEGDSIGAHAPIINKNTIEHEIKNFPDSSILTIITLELSDEILTVSIRTKIGSADATDGGSEEALSLIHTTVVGEYTRGTPVYTD